MLFFTLRSYILVLLVPLVVSVLFYAFSSRETQKYAIQLNNSVLHSASNSLDLRLQEVEHIATEIVDSDSVKLFQSNTAGFEYPYSYQMISARGALRNYALTQSFIKDYFIAFNRSKIVMNYNIIYTYDDFFEDYLTLPDALPDALRDRIAEGRLSTGLIPAREISILSETDRCITLIHPLMGSRHSSEGYLAILIDEEDVISLFSDINIGDSGAIYIADSNGEMMTGFAGKDAGIEEVFAETAERALSGEETEPFYIDTPQGRLLVNILRSGVSGLTYVSAQPLSLILAQVYAIRNLMLILLFIALAAGVLLSIWQARRISTPVSAILSEIGVDPEEPNEAFQSIREMIIRLRTNYDHLYELASEHRSLLRSSFLSRLLSGGINSEAEAVRIWRHVFPNRLRIQSIRVLLIHITEADERGQDDEVTLKLLASIKVTLKDALDRNLDQPLYYDIDEETLALLIVNTDKEDIDSLFLKLFEELPEPVRERICVTGGGEETELTRVVRSREQAHIALAMQQYSLVTPPHRVAWLDNVPAPMQYFYPVDMRRQLSEAVRGGNKDAVRQILDEVFQKNYGDPPIPEPARKLFIADLLGTAVRCIALICSEESRQHEFAERFDPIHRAPSQKQPALLQELFLDLAELSGSRQSAATNQLVGEVIEYLRTHYSENNLSLTGIADHFGVNAPFLSATFK